MLYLLVVTCAGQQRMGRNIYLVHLVFKICVFFYLFFVAWLILRFASSNKNYHVVTAPKPSTVSACFFAVLTALPSHDLNVPGPATTKGTLRALVACKYRRRIGSATDFVDEHTTRRSHSSSIAARILDKMLAYIISKVQNLLSCRKTHR